jgi:NAD(P)-dependent dehydrogenase (short-subunit alcohol dehydrogenase family)
MTQLNGKTALITGGTSGIGLATAKAFQQLGAKVAITGQNVDRLNQAVNELGKEVVPIHADVRSLADIEAMVTTVKEKFRKLDTLFVNAGITKLAPMGDVTAEFIDETMDVNFKGAFFTIQKAVSIMPQGSTIVINTSVNNQMGMLGSSIYAASKAGLRSLTRTLAAELIGQGIRVNAVSPGPISTPIYGKLGIPQQQLQEFAQQIQQQIPMHRFGEPDEIAKAVVFLASDDSSFVLGEEIVVDGGWTQL